MTTSTLEALRARYGDAVEAALRDELSGRSDTDEFSGMLLYPFGYTDAALRPTSVAGGKRFRPMLCLLACESAGGDWRLALRAAAAVEMLHNFSLVHDDIEDGDTIRRHRETVWRLWGEPHGINIGDAIFALAFGSMLRAHDDPVLCLDLARTFAQTTMELTEGQYLDMSFERRLDVTPALYLDMIRRKSAALIAFSGWAGARIAGAPAGTADALWSFGIHMGQAFQIHDDIMGIWGTSERTGKAAGMDLRKRKKTLPVLIAFERANSQDRDDLEAFYLGRVDDEALIVQVMDRTLCGTLAQEARDRHLRQGLDALDGTSLGTAEKQLLSSLAREITGQRVASN